MKSIRINLKWDLIVLAVVAVIAFGVGWIIPGEPGADSQTIYNQITAIENLETFSYQFTHILQYDKDKSKNIFDKIPLTQKKYLATIDGETVLRVNLQKLKVNTSRNSDGSLKSIKIRYPHSEIGNIYLNHKTLKEYDVRNGFLNPVTPSDLKSCLIRAELEVKNEVKERGMLNRSDKRFEQLVTSWVRTFYGDTVNIDINAL